MANPQVEEGFTKIANELIEIIAKTKFNGTQFRILMVIWRFTYGFNRKSHEFSLSFLSEATGCHKQQLKKELDRLIQMKVILVFKEANFNRSRMIGFNKNYEDWQLKELQSIKKSTVSKLTDTTVSENAYSTVSEFAYQEINNKKNINKSSSSNWSVKKDTVSELTDTLKLDKVAATKEETDISIIAKEYQNCGFGLINMKVKEYLEALLEEYSVEWIKQAFSICVERNKRNLSYAKGILQNWKRDGGMKLEVKNKAPTLMPVKKNTFHNFKQTTNQYSEDELERKLKAKWGLK